MEAQHHLDATGLLCPEPVMMLHNKVRDNPGDLLVRHRPSPSETFPNSAGFWIIPWGRLRKFIADT